MHLLSARFDAQASRRGASLGIPVAQISGVFVILLALGEGLQLGARPLVAVGSGVLGGAIQACLMALAWALALDGRPAWRAPAIRLGSALLLAAIGSRFTGWAALLYLVIPGLFVREAARHKALRSIGVGAPESPMHALLGLIGGAFLGVHLLVSASLTLGYGVRLEGLRRYLLAAAYDAGANGLTAECLFRGALFSRWWRRRDFWSAATLSTAMAAARYLLDPALPAVLEMRAGAVFYTALLGFGACALRAASGSLLPGYLATLSFFAFYRLLAP